MKPIELFTPEDCRFATQADAEVGFKEFDIMNSNPKPCLLHLLNEKKYHMTAFGWRTKTHKQEGTCLFAFEEDEELISLGFQISNIQELKEGDVFLNEIGDYFKIGKTVSGYCLKEMTALLDQKDAEKVAKLRGVKKAKMELGTAACNIGAFPVWFSKMENGAGAIALPVLGEYYIPLLENQEEIRISPWPENIPGFTASGQLFEVRREPHLHLKSLSPHKIQNLPS